MRSGPRSRERLLTLSARMLAGASVATTVGVALVLRMSWQQAGQSYGQDGQVQSDVPLGERLAMMMLEFSYRQIGVHLVLSAALLGAAVVVLHRNPSWAQVRRVRWEVAGAWLVTAACAVGLLVVDLYVLTPSDEASEGLSAYMGPQPTTTEMLLGNLPTLVASVLTLTAVALWWMRLEPVVDETVEGPTTEPTEPAQSTEPTEPTEEPRDDRDVTVGQEPAGRPPVLPKAPRDSADNLGSGADMGYPQDWSPEDFRRPS